MSWAAFTACADLPGPIARLLSVPKAAKFKAILGSILEFQLK